VDKIAFQRDSCYALLHGLKRNIVVRRESTTEVRMVERFLAAAGFGLLGALVAGLVFSLYRSEQERGK